MDSLQSIANKWVFWIDSLRSKWANNGLNWFANQFDLFRSLQKLNRLMRFHQETRRTLDDVNINLLLKAKTSHVHSPYARAVCRHTHVRNLHRMTKIHQWLTSDSLHTLRKCFSHMTWDSQHLKSVWISCNCKPSMYLDHLRRFSEFTLYAFHSKCKTRQVYLSNISAISCKH